MSTFMLFLIALFIFCEGGSIVSAEFYRLLRIQQRDNNVSKENKAMSDFSLVVNLAYVIVCIYSVIHYPGITRYCWAGLFAMGFFKSALASNSLENKVKYNIITIIDSSISIILLLIIFISNLPN